MTKKNVAKTQEHFGLSLRDGLCFVRLLLTPERMLDGRRTEQFFSDEFFSTEFWGLCSGIMGSLPEDSAIEFRRHWKWQVRDMTGLMRTWRLVSPSRQIIAQERGQVTFTKKTPPKGALIDWLTPPEYADDRIHALLTGYDRWVQKYGDGIARRMFLVQSIGVVLGFWVYWLAKHINLLKSQRPSS
jgi:hypothetical protein